MGQTNMIFTFKQGARVPSHVTAEYVHDHLCAVRERHGRLSAESVAADVEQRGVAHPLGWAFTWDADAGLHKLHVIEAGHLIRIVSVSEIVPDQQEPIRAFSVIREDGENVYGETAVIIRQPDLRAQLLDQVEAEYERAARKMRELVALLRLI